MTDDEVWTDCPFKGDVPKDIIIKRPRGDTVRLVGPRLFIDIPYGEKERAMTPDDFAEAILDPTIDRLQRLP